MANEAIVWLAIAVPLFVYVASAISTGRAIATRGPGPFLLAPGSLSTFAFGTSAIAYGFQIASVSLFIVWGYKYGLAALLNPLFWFIGIVLFRYYIDRVLLAQLQDATLHGILGHHYHSSALIRISSYMTMIGYMGTILAELVVGISVLQIIVSNKLLLFSVACGAVIVVATYIALVGQRIALETDQLQLAFSYIAYIALAIAISLILLFYRPHSNSVFIAVGLILLVLLNMFISVHRHTGGLLRLLERVTSWKHLAEHGPAILMLGCLLFSVLVISTYLIQNSQSFINLRTVQETQYERFTYFECLSLILLPVFWQFIDVPMWQRLSAIQRVEISGKVDVPALRSALLRYAWESPATWTLAILIGVSIRAGAFEFNEGSVENAISEIPRLLLSGLTQLGFWSYILGMIWISATIATMLSTVDSMLSSSLFVGIKDFSKPQIELPDQRFDKKVVSILALISAFIIAACLLQIYLDQDFISILLFGYAAQLSLVPLVLGITVFPTMQTGSNFAIASVLAGCVASFVGIALPHFDVSVSALGAPVLSLAASFSIYGAGILTKFFRGP